MKFLCPTCKAKYQIADEKVAGRSVRMKCRKCGYLISISKAVTDGSVSRKLSSIPPAPDESPSKVTPPPKPAPTPKPAPARPSPARPGPAARPSWSEPGRASSPELRGPPPRPGRPAAGPPPRERSTDAGAATPSPPAAGGALAAVPVAPPRAKSGNGAGGHGLFEERVDDERTVIAGLGALAGTFSEQVASQDASALASSLASTDEWYVGINGVPVGPIRLSELRSKASAGAISVESLVWRDGFEQWLPLSDFPELVAIVEEGLSSARASLTPLSPPVAAAPPAAPRPEVYDPFAQPQTPFGTMESPGSAAPLTEPSAGYSPFAPYGQQPAQPTPFGATGTGITAVSPPVDEDEVVPLRRRGGTSPMAWVAVGVALMLGLTIGFVMFNKKPPEPVVQYVTVPATGGPANPVATGATGQVEEPAGEVEADAGSIKVAKGATGTAPTKSTAPDKPGEKPLTGLAGLQGLQGTGPSSGPATGSTGGGSSGQPLESGEIQKTVGKYTSSVKRSCWQPALDARTKDAPTSARVNVTIVVSPSGSVQSVSTSGDPKGYPGLSSCIASRVRGWQFPASSGTTTVNVPFVFASQ